MHQCGIANLLKAVESQTTPVDASGHNDLPVVQSGKYRAGADVNFYFYIRLPHTFWGCIFVLLLTYMQKEKMLLQQSSPAA